MSNLSKISIYILNRYKIVVRPTIFDKILPSIFDKILPFCPDILYYEISSPSNSQDKTHTAECFSLATAFLGTHYIGYRRVE